MTGLTERSLDDLLDLLREEGLIDRYEASVSNVTIYQSGGSYSLALDSARDFAGRIVRALGLDAAGLSARVN